jgi:hypothetical protein
MRFPARFPPRDVRTCLDRTGLRPHLGGRVGAAFFQHALDHGWVTRKGTTRIVAVTDTGRAVLREQLGLGKRGTGGIRLRTLLLLPTVPRRKLKPDVEAPQKPGLSVPP